MRSPSSKSCNGFHEYRQMPPGPADDNGLTRLHQVVDLETGLFSNRSGWPIRFQSPMLLVILILLTTSMLWLYNSERLNQLFIPAQQVLLHEEFYTDNSPGYLIDTAGCRIPDLNPFDDLIKAYIANPKGGIDCGRNGNFSSSSTGNNLFLNVSDIAAKSGAKCCFRYFQRVSQDPFNYTSKADDEYRYDDKCIPILKPVTTVTREFLKVECHVGKKLVFKNFHAFPIPKRSLVEDPRGATASRKHLSVLVLGIDAVSRLNMIRKMPLTRKVLRSELDCVEMLGYNKVEDNTFPNLVPVFAGLTEGELVQKCWPRSNTKLDECPWVWKDYQSLGYRTMLVEDTAWMGTFNYVKTGFVKQPVDYYLRPFSLAIDQEIGHLKDFNGNLCLGESLCVQRILDYLKEFAVSLKDQLTFSFTWTNSLSHDYLNYPFYADPIYSTLLSDLVNRGVFDHTVLIFLSDHGIRWGDIRKTFQGRLEERLPILQVCVPKSFKSEHPSAVRNLVTNARRLTTPFDLHETLKDLQHPDNLTDGRLQSQKDDLEKRLKEGGQYPRGISLFRVIPRRRNCSDAGISDHWCTCLKNKPANRSNHLVKTASNWVLEELNRILENYRQCSKLQLKTIVDARISDCDHQSATEPKEGPVDVTVVIDVQPSLATFESTVRLWPKGRKPELTGTISRINRYGNQSSCVNEYHMKKYCYCQ